MERVQTYARVRGPRDALGRTRAGALPLARIRSGVRRRPSPTPPDSLDRDAESMRRLPERFEIPETTVAAIGAA
jgi:hypothetical protein